MIYIKNGQIQLTVLNVQLVQKKDNLKVEVVQVNVCAKQDGVMMEKIRCNAFLNAITIVNSLMGNYLFIYNYIFDRQ